MRFDELLSKLDDDIIAQKQAVSQLEDKRNKLLALQDKIPAAIYHNGAICLPDIWDRITCMKIERKQYYTTGKTDIIAKFSVGKKFRVNGRKLYSYPFENKIASIVWSPPRYTSNTSPAINNIIVEDVNALIDNECSKKKSFIHRIKLFVIDEIRRYQLVVDDAAFNHEISKLLLLR